MTEEQKTALQVVIDMLDQMMVKNPSRELADCSNYLEVIKKGDQDGSSSE